MTTRRGFVEQNLVEGQCRIAVAVILRMIAARDTI